MDPLLLCYDRQSTSLRQNYRMAEGLHVLISSTLDVRKETYLASTFAGHFETYLMSTDTGRMCWLAVPRFTMSRLTYRTTIAQNQPGFVTRELTQVGPTVLLMSHQA